MNNNIIHNNFYHFNFTVCWKKNEIFVFYQTNISETINAVGKVR